MTAEEKRKLITHKAEVLKAIAHPARLCILSCLMQSQKCNVSKLQKQLEIPQSTLSQHLAKLKSIGVIEGDRNGVNISYRIIDDEIKEMMTHYLKNVIQLEEREELKC